MKKLWMLPVLAIFLAACGNNADEQTDQDTKPAVDVSEPENDTEVEPEVSEPVESGDTETDSTQKDESAGTVDPKLEGFEEFSVLEEQLQLTDLTAEVEADNQGKRVILFENNSGEKVYKSIFVKHDQHVKIIDLKKDGLVYEGKITQ